jgi:hypothetical protein
MQSGSMARAPVAFFPKIRHVPSESFKYVSGVFLSKLVITTNEHRRFRFFKIRIYHSGITHRIERLYKMSSVATEWSFFISE